MGTSFISFYKAYGAPFTKTFIFLFPAYDICSATVDILFNSDLNGYTFCMTTLSNTFLASFDFELYYHLERLKNISSIGSPVSYLSTEMRLWQPARTTKLSLLHVLKSFSSLNLLQSSTIPSKMNLSYVRVPVLSKAIVFALPPRGIFLG